MRIAIFPGTFDPFTIGHYSIVERGLKLFDKIIIAIGYNEQKANAEATAEQRRLQIKEIYSDVNSVEVIAYNGLTTNCAKKYNADFILRGFRTVADFEYERNMADINRKLSGIETVLLYTLPEHASISSSIVRELLHNSVDVTEFLPQKHQY